MGGTNRSGMELLKGNFKGKNHCESKRKIDIAY
jgi:hypothetical protein